MKYVKTEQAPMLWPWTCLGLSSGNSVWRICPVTTPSHPCGSRRRGKDSVSVVSYISFLAPHFGEHCCEETVRTCVKEVHQLAGDSRVCSQKTWSISCQGKADRYYVRRNWWLSCCLWPQSEWQAPPMVSAHVCGQFQRSTCHRFQIQR